MLAWVSSSTAARELTRSPMCCLESTGQGGAHNVRHVTLVERADLPPKKMGDPLPDRPCFDRMKVDQVRLLATAFSVLLTLVPTVLIAVMAATAISEAINVYSMAVAPFSFFMRRRKMDSI
jgi:hypothetical protein